MLGLLILAIFFISVFWGYPVGPRPFSEKGGAYGAGKKLVVLGFCLLFLILGVWHHQQAESRITNNELRKYNDLEQKVTLIGAVIKEPNIREENIKLTVKIEELYCENCSRSIDGKILVTVNRYSRYNYGDKLKIIGRLQTPKVFEDFNYKNYLAKDGVYSVMYKPKIELLTINDGEPFSVIYEKILQFKDRLRQSIYRSLSPPQSAILGAMILGDKRKMPSELKEKLNIAGLRHITAVSGMHVAILTSILMTFLLGLGFWRQHSFYFTIILIALFIVLTGLQASAVRAGIMGGLFLLAQHLGRPNRSSRAIVFAATIMLLHNPLLLRLDIGFQLSFLAMLGIIYLSPTFNNWFKFIPEEHFLNLRSILAMSFSAYFFTLPILIYNFGRFSTVALITNLLVLPSIYWIMIFGFVFGLAGLIWQPLAWVLSWPAWLLLTYVVKIIDWFSQIPWAQLTLEISWFWLVVAYLFLGMIAWRLHKKFTLPLFLR